MPGAGGGVGDDVDGADAVDVEVRFVHPFQARKGYRCPGCDQEIPPGTGHLVVVPRRAPEDRRHWHRPCWEHRRTRRPTGG